MDDITRQFFVLIRKIKLDIHTALKELQLVQPTSDPSYEQYSPDPNSEKPEQPDELLVAIKAIQAAEGTADAKNYALDHRRYRLEWKGFRMARWGAVVLAIYTALTAVIAIYSIRSVNAAHEALTRSNRPWLGKDGDVALQVSNTGEDFIGGSISFTVRNFGPSPALHVGYGIQPFVRIRDGKDAWNETHEEARKQACQLADTLAFIGGDSIFPQQGGTYTTSGAFRTPGFKKAYKLFLISGCLAYRDQFDPNRTTHHTTFCVVGPGRSSFQDI